MTGAIRRQRELNARRSKNFLRKKSSCRVNQVRNRLGCGIEWDFLAGQRIAETTINAAAGKFGLDLKRTKESRGNLFLSLFSKKILCSAHPRIWQKLSAETHISVRSLNPIDCKVFRKKKTKKPPKKLKKTIGQFNARANEGGGGASERGQPASQPFCRT